MILLVTTSNRGNECAAALEQGTGHKTLLVSSVSAALSRLQSSECKILAIDQSLLEADFRALDVLLNHAGAAMPLYLNLALHGSERIVREVQVALRRTENEKLAAMRSAQSVLRSQLRDEVTGILLNSELALRQPAVPAPVAEKLRQVQNMAEKMRTCLEAG
jgi:hypothetical protein